ncbi:DNA alkylation repair protein [Hoyosella altamirensis]|uniref:DNA alkylation repair protein n=1 Tax=Hoyosella altamirensis TaxID=616997 RepID=UPI0007DB45A3|nr:DNA alkylation repair protein [Hoyosella altamirensis]
MNASPGLAAELTDAVARLSDPETIPAKARFFQALPNGYAAGDKFLGVRVPQLRGLARRYRSQVTVDDADELLLSEWHEVRLLGAILLVEIFSRADEQTQRRIATLMLKRSERLNNWDLIDSSIPYTLGPWLYRNPAERHVLVELAEDDLLWRRRAAMMATFAFIRAGEFGETVDLALKLLGDPHDLIHKAVGWMLREVGARDRQVLDTFLDEHAPSMPRTMLRYAIEKHSPEERREILMRKT